MYLKININIAHKQFLYLFGERGVLVDVLCLIAAEVFGAVSADRAAVLGDVVVAATVVLGRVIVIATVILGSDRFTFYHGVELGGALQRRHTVTPSGRGENANI